MLDHISWKFYQPHENEREICHLNVDVFILDIEGNIIHFNFGHLGDIDAFKSVHSGQVDGTDRLSRTNTNN
jgi:hypothetical protein